MLALKIPNVYAGLLAILHSVKLRTKCRARDVSPTPPPPSWRQASSLLVTDASCVEPEYAGGRDTGATRAKPKGIGSLSPAQSPSRRDSITQPRSKPEGIGILSPEPIPKGLNHSAQGCEARATLGGTHRQKTPLQECSGSFSLSGIKVQSTQMEEDVRLETLFVPIAKGFFDQPLDFIV